MQPKPKRPVQDDGRVHGVVVAIRRDDGKLLMVRRSATVSVALKVCFPGGAVEAGEPQRDAVVREMREELGIEVRPIECVWRWHSQDAPLTLWGWTAELVAGQVTPDAAEIAEVLWLSADEGCDHSDGLPTNRQFIAAVCHPNPQPSRKS
jgi:8-oxo-dGTP diphosphatase